MKETFEEFLERHELVDDSGCCSGVGPGWFPLLEDCFAELTAAGWDRKFTQIKEKFGGLRFYIRVGSNEQNDIISWYEAKSFKTCEACGDPGKLRKKGWCKTYCDSCEASP